MSSSEVARLRQQIAEEYEASQRALHGLAAGTARHQFITARMERMSIHMSELVDLVGMEEAAKVFVEAVEGESSPPA